MSRSQIILGALAIALLFLGLTLTRGCGNAAAGVDDDDTGPYDDDDNDWPCIGAIEFLGPVDGNDDPSCEYTRAEESISPFRFEDDGSTGFITYGGATHATLRLLPSIHGRCGFAWDGHGLELDPASITSSCSSADLRVDGGPSRTWTGETIP